MSVQSREVSVIGAGIAGLTAARDLAIDGYDVAILEARERIGGRIWTSHGLGLPADLGASWIHGFEDNPIERLARRHDIAIVRTNISSVTPARYRSMSSTTRTATGSAAARQPRCLKCKLATF
jgi:phytoene dehydrogenase-like protein